jgi:squalene synthase HpnD
MMAAVETATALPAAGSSFYTAMRILPRPRREAMYAVYAFCRAVDDVADGDAPRPERLTELERWRADIDRLFAGAAPRRLAGLAEPIRRFSLEHCDFHAVIDGMAMDAAADLQAPDWATLDLYCDRVASAVGRMSAPIFGLAAEPGKALAHHLGRALQLTNILRDLDEDAAINRLYLPREALVEAGIDTVAPLVVLSHPGLGTACSTVAARARLHFTDADRIMATSPRAVVRAPRLMGAAYRTILDRLETRGWQSPRLPVRISRPRLLLAVLRYGLV